MKKRATSLLLAVVIVVTGYLLFPVFTLAAQTESDGDLITDTTLPQTIGTDNAVLAFGTCGENLAWILDDQGTLTISGTGDMDNYSIDEAAPWYENQDSIQNVVLLEGVTSIGDCAFSHCWYLTEVTMPSTITSVGADAFYSCESLTKVTMSESITSIGEAAFFGCVSLSDITIPSGISSIADYTFMDCNLGSVYISSGITVISETAFAGSGVDAYIVDSDNPNYCDIDGVLYDKAKTTLIAYPSGSGNKVYTIPNGVTSIGDSAFAFHAGVEKLILPQSVSYIDTCAFYMAVYFVPLDIYITNPKLSFGASVFNGCTEGLVFHGAEGSTTEEYAAGWSDFVALEEHQVTDGADSIVPISQTVTVRIDAEYSEFEGVAVDGQMLEASAYTVSQGSTIVTLENNFINTLTPGKHELITFFANGIAVTSFTIESDMVGDGNNDYIPGDINGDGSVNNKDVTRLFQHLSGWVVSVNEKALDVNGDGCENNKDLTRLFQYLSNWDVEIH